MGEINHLLKAGARIAKEKITHTAWPRIWRELPQQALQSFPDQYQMVEAMKCERELGQLSILSKTRLLNHRART